MIDLLSKLLMFFTVALTVPVAVFFVEILGAILIRPPSGAAPVRNQHGRIAALIPAHDEGKGLLTTLTKLKQQLRPGDRLVVVADNCSDDTAQVAAVAGAEVTERNDLSKIGKGYALDWGLNYLSSDPPNTVIIVDADCQVKPGSLGQLAVLSEQTQRPVQALYLMSAPDRSAINHQVASFAWRVKNWIRPLGLRALGLPCQLMGTGMAMPWALARLADLSSGAIVEDLKLGLDLATIGYAPIFCPEAVVYSTFPETSAGAMAQRQRWEHGHIGLMITRIPSLLARGIAKRDRALISMALDLIVPPLTLLIVLILLMTMTTALASYLGASIKPLFLSLADLAILMLGVVLAWSRCARDILPPKTMGLLPGYVFAKLQQYLSALSGRRVSRWVRADRN